MFLHAQCFFIWKFLLKLLFHKLHLTSWTIKKLSVVLYRIVHTVVEMLELIVNFDWPVVDKGTYCRRYRTYQDFSYPIFNYLRMLQIYPLGTLLTTNYRLPKDVDRNNLEVRYSWNLTLDFKSLSTLSPMTNAPIKSPNIGTSKMCMVIAMCI